MPRPRPHEVGASPCASAWRRAATVRMTCGSVVEGREGLVRTSQMSFQGRTWRVGVTVFHVALPSVAANSTVMSRMRAVRSAMHSSQVPEVRSRRYSLPTCTMRVRICVFAAPRALLRRLYRLRLTVHHRRLTRAQLRHRCRVHYFVLSFIRLRIAEQNTTGREGSARVHARFYGRWMNSAPASYQRGRGRVMRSRCP